MSTTNSRGLILPTVGSDTSTWGGYLNNNFAYITQMFGTVLSVNVASGYALSTAETQNGTIQLTGTLTNNVDVTFPNVSGVWNIENRTVGNFYVRLKTATGNNATIGIPQGKTSQIFVDITSSSPGVKFINPADPGTYWDYASGTTPVWFSGCTSDGTVAQLPWVTCDGSAVSRTTYPYLYQAIGTTWGIGDGTTTFNVPDLRNRARVSVMSSGARLTAAVSGIDGAVVGSGASTSESTTLLTSQIPSHSHSPTLTDPGHLHNSYGIAAGNSIGQGSSYSNQISATSTSTTGITVSVGNTGGGTAHTNVQPTAIAGLTFIKT